ncbi:MAG TPA: hypothetical protein VJ770_13270 [Stellaceae bacterium]|nr:hypothetical protein [Stellaceae bacterium]
MATVLLRSDRIGRFPPASTASRPAFSTGTRAQLLFDGLAATRGLPPPSAPAEPPSPELSAKGEMTLSDSRGAAAAPQDRHGVSQDAEAGSVSAKAGAAEAGPQHEGAAGRPQVASETAAPAAKPVKPGRIEMTIDSLPNYDLLQPIPVVIEALGDRVFAAEAPDLQISTTGSSVGGSFLQLKEQIAAIYEQCRQKNTVTPERLHQIRLFQSYIGKAKRGWSLGRG